MVHDGGSGNEKSKSPVARQTEVLGLPVLVMAEITIRLGVVMAILMGIGRFHVFCLGRQIFGIMALKTFHHWYSHSLSGISMAVVT